MWRKSWLRVEGGGGLEAEDLQGKKAEQTDFILGRSGPEQLKIKSLLLPREPI